jgi:hypothetical protein
MKETFRRKIIQIGDSIGFTIPIYFLDSKKVEMGGEYEITINIPSEGEADKEWLTTQNKSDTQ